MRFHGMLIGNQHEIWSKQHNGKVRKKLLKAKIAAALYHENGKVPTPEEIDKWTKFAQVLYTAVLGLHFERQEQKKNRQLAVF
jgi:hypothetical protein